MSLAIGRSNAILLMHVLLCVMNADRIDLQQLWINSQGGRLYNSKYGNVIAHKYNANFTHHRGRYLCKRHSNVNPMRYSNVNPTSDDFTILYAIISTISYQRFSFSDEESSEQSKSLLFTRFALSVALVKLPNTFFLTEPLKRDYSLFYSCLLQSKSYYDLILRLVPDEWTLDNLSMQPLLKIRILAMHGDYIPSLLTSIWAIEHLKETFHHWDANETTFINPSLMARWTINHVRNQFLCMPALTRPFYSFKVCMDLISNLAKSGQSGVISTLLSTLKNIGTLRIHT